MVDANLFEKKMVKDVILADTIFNQNNIPLQYKKIIIKVNIPVIFNKCELEELTTGFPFDLTGGKIENRDEEKFICASNLPGYFNGQIFDRNISFKTRLQYKSYDEVMKFLSEIYDKGYFQQYLESIKQLYSLNLDLDFIFKVWNEEKNARKTLRLYKKEHRNKGMN